VVAAKAADGVEQLLQFGVPQDGGRFIEHDDAGIARDRLGDLHHLALRDADCVDARARVDPEAEPSEHFRRLLTGAAPIDQTEAVAWHAAEKDVLGDREVRRLG
jgi:hypothetical protein